MGNTKNVSTILRLSISIVICQVVGAAGAFSVIPAIVPWYDTLKKPFLIPPNWAVVPIWIVLYLLMGVALFLVWNTKDKTANVKTVAATTFVIQSGLNTIWPILFFTLRSPSAAFIEFMALWIMVIFNAFIFWRISKTACYLLLPYVLWITAAGIVNFYVILMN